MTIVHPAVREGFNKEKVAANPEAARIRAEIANLRPDRELPPPPRPSGASSAASQRPIRPERAQPQRAPAPGEPQRSTRREARAKVKGARTGEVESTRAGVAAQKRASGEITSNPDERRGGGKRGNDTLVKAIASKLRTNVDGFKIAAKKLTAQAERVPPSSVLATIGKNALPVTYERGAHLSKGRRRHAHMPWANGQDGEYLPTFGKRIVFPDEPFNPRVPANEGRTGIPGDWDHQMRSGMTVARLNQDHPFNLLRIAEY